MSSRFVYLLLLCAACGTVQAANLLMDPGFERGYDVMSPKRDVYTDLAKLEAIHREPGSDKAGAPAWHLVQWGSRATLANVKPEVIPDGGTVWRLYVDPAHQVLLKSVNTGLRYPVPGQPPARYVALELNAQEEFRNQYLQSNEQYWPHLLMLQKLNTQKLAMYKRLLLSLDAQLLFDHLNKQQGYQKDLHAARFVASILVHNTLSGNSFWLNLPIYDDRFPQSGFGCQKCLEGTCRTATSLDEPGRWLCPFDGERWSKTAVKKGTRHMIFRIPTAAMTQDDIHAGKPIQVSIDLLPYIKAGIDAAQQQEKLKGFNHSLMFYNLTLFSLGWEITGLNHAALEISNLSLLTE